MSRRSIDFLAPEIGRDALRITLIFRDQGLHLGKGRNALIIRLALKGETWAIDLDPFKTLVLIFAEQIRILMPTCMEQISSYVLSLSSVQPTRSGNRAFPDIYDAYN